MLWLLLEAALRSLLLGAIVGLGLKLTRVRDPRAHMTAWTGVLIASLAMPAMMHWLVVTVPSSAPPLQLVEMIEAAPNALLAPVAESLDLSVSSTQPEAASPSVTNTKPARTGSDAGLQPPRAARIDWFVIATSLYVAVTAVFLLRLCVGLVLTWRLARAAAPIGADWSGAGCGNDRVRVSDIVGMPVTFGSTILLPRECVEWDRTKCQAVLTHERAHIAHGDFYILLLAMLNRALFWFSPFAWWQVQRLAELAEMISDDAAIEVLADRPSYADILVEFAGDAPRAPAGLAMARANTVRQRVERILAAKGLPVRTGWRPQVLIAAILVPLTAICAGTIARGTAPTAAALGADPTGHDPYAGWYRLNPLQAIAVTRNGERLFGQVTGGPRFELTPQGENNRFTFAKGNASITFVSDGDVPARELLMQDRRERHASRIEAAQGQELGELFARRMASAPERFMDQAPAPGSKSALLQTISDLQHGGANTAHIGGPLAERLRHESPPLPDTLAALGAVESIFFRGVGPGGYDIYGAKFANGSAEFRLLMGPGGVTEDLIFRPDGDATQGGILACAQEPMLKSAAATAPIKLLLFNASGADIHLYGLDAQGQRTRHIALADNRSAPIMTRAGSAWVVADGAGQCREIVVAGQHTRFVSLRHAGSGEEPDRFASRRSAPTPGSEDALLAHIDALARGEPDYSRMTPEAAALTRQQAELDRAILAKLGAVRAVSFRGVTPFDSDIYVVHFTAGSAEWRIALVNDGRIGRIALGPQY
jgi:beta-lactamase regulating signal transducer with metallopeptidase domain